MFFSVSHFFQDMLIWSSIQSSVYLKIILPFFLIFVFYILHKSLRKCSKTIKQKTLNDELRFCKISTKPEVRVFSIILLGFWRFENQLIICECLTKITQWFSKQGKCLIVIFNRLVLDWRLGMVDIIDNDSKYIKKG